MQHVAFAARQALAEREQAHAAGPGRELRAERHGVGRLAEELHPLALAFARHLVRENAHCLMARQRGEQLAHADRSARARRTLSWAAPFFDHRLQPRELGRAVEHRDRKFLGGDLGGDFEATQVRGEEHDALAGRARGIHMLPAVDPAHEPHDVGTGAQPHGGKFGEQAAGTRDRRVPRGRVAIARRFEIVAQVAPVSGRQPIHRPPEQRTHHVQNREWKTCLQGSSGSATSGILAAPFLQRLQTEPMSDFCLLPNRFPRAIRTRSRTRFPTPVLDAISKAGQEVARRRRDAGQGQPRGAGRGDHHRRARQLRPGGAPDHQPHRLQRSEDRLRHAYLHGPSSPMASSRRTSRRAWTKARDSTSTRRGRPGPDVRLRLRRNAGTDAACRSTSRTVWSSVNPKSAADGRMPWLRPDAKSQVTIK